jgi:RNA polymerase sigma-70 factor (ECF subfamily)
MTRNKAIDLLRTRALRLEVEIPEALRFERLTEDDVFAQLDSEAVRSALDALPETQRSLILMGFFGGLTHEQMALKTGVPLGTVKTRIRTGLLKMRSTLAPMATA